MNSRSITIVRRPRMVQVPVVQRGSVGPSLPARHLLVAAGFAGGRGPLVAPAGVKIVQEPAPFEGRAKAADGDISAAKLILSYKLGKPAPAPNPDEIDRDEWEH